MEASHRVMGASLKAHGFSLQVRRKTCEGRGHADGDSQFELTLLQRLFVDIQPISHIVDLC
ncbi:hypothetical protein EZS27_034252 [termite gut metagenome]|uniref:Uncharacterized protein n=1 Tax=termite gut metagenome TaxID=433724 RepID=A0A5J4Q3P7_9ZZZZ